MSDRTLHPLFSSFLGTVFILYGVLAPVRAESPALFGLDDIPLAPARLSPPDPSSVLLGLGEIDLSRSRRWAALQEQSRLSGKDGAPAGARGGALPELAGLEQPALDSHLEQYVAEPLRQTSEHLKGLFSNQQQVTGVLNQIQQGGVDIEQRLARAGEEKLQSMVDGRLQDIEQRLQGSILPQLNLSYRAPFAGREELFHVNATLSLWETSSHLLFNQGGLLLRDGKDGANLGLGYRFLAGEGLLLGVNTFYDWLSDPDVERWSVGAEARSAWLDLHGNWYQGRGNDRDGDTLYYSPDGWDIELAAHLPTVPWVELGASYYLWEGEGGQNDLEGHRYQLSLKPFTLWNIGLEYDDPDGDSGSWGVKTDLNYQFGVPLSNQLALRGTQGTPDLWSRRYEKVEREYAIRVRERQTVSAERLSVDFAELFPGPVNVPVRLPAGRFYEFGLTPADFTETNDLPGDIAFTVARTSPTLATLTLTYTRAIPLPLTTPTGTIRITVLDTGLTRDSGDLSNQVIVDVLAAAPTTARPLIGRPLPFRMPGCLADACVVPAATGAPVPLLSPLQLPITPVESSTCATCQISLAFDLEFGGTAVYGDDYMVTGLTLTPTRNTAVSPVTIPPPAAPTPPATASDTFEVSLTSLSTHYLNVTLILMPDTDPDTNAERKDIQLVYVDRGDDDLIDNEDDRGAPQTVLTLEPPGTRLPFASVADTPLTESSLVASTATATVTLIDSEYVETGALDTADFTLTTDVPGTVTVAGVARTSAMVATLTLRHEGADISDDGTLDVIVEASAHSGAVALYAGSVPITARSGDATLSGLTVSAGTLTPLFVAATTDYTLNVASTVTSVILTATTTNADATVSGGGSITAGSLIPGSTRVVPIVVTAADGRTMTYRVRITNAPDLMPTFGSQTVAPQRYTMGADVGTVQLPEATGGDGALSYTLTPVLPNGLSFDANTRQITGIPTATMAETSYTLTATDSDATNPDQATLVFTITVAAAGPVTVGLNADIAGDDVVNIEEKAAGFVISGTVANGATVEVTLDSGTARGATEIGTTWTLAIPANDPEITGTSVVVEATATLAGATSTVNRTITVDLVAPTATYTPPGTLTVGTPIIAIPPVNPSSDVAGYTVQSGAIPPGLTLVEGTGVISGAPTTADIATANVTIRLTDSAGNPGDVPIAFPAVAMGSQTLVGFTYSEDTATVGQPVPTVTPPTGAVAGSTLSYSTTSAGICTVNSSTGALTLVAAGDCVITVTASATTNYNEASADFTITVSSTVSPPAAGVTVTPATLSVPEDGSTMDTYTLVLDTAPTADVTIAVASDTVTAVTVSSASLTFTPANWNTAQTVTVTGVNDDVDNPSDERTATVTHVPTSADAGYTSVVIDSVTVTVEDDDDAGVTVDPMALMVPEASGTGTYTVVLDTQPTGNVTITPESGDTMAATVSGALTFTTTDWSTAQTVTVTGVNDNVDNPGNARTATLTHTASGADGNYSGGAINIASVTVTVQDDDDPTAGTVTVTLNPGIAGNDEVNIAEQMAGFDIGGTVEDGATVSVTFDGSAPFDAIVDATTASTPTWIFRIPGNSADIADTSVVVVVTAMLTATGDTGTVTRMVDIDLVAPTATYTAPGTLTVGTAITDIMPGSPSSDISSYMVQAGNLPPGLTLVEGTGVISGTPTTANAATVPVTIRLTDTAGNIVNLAPIIFPAVTMGSQTLSGFAYSANTATVGQTVPTVMPPTGAVVGSTLSYTTTSAGICTVNSSTGALTLVGAGTCTITVTASATTNYNEATAEFTITVAAAGAAGVTVTPTTLSVPEDGGEGTYTLVLTSAPTADVTITPVSGDTMAATVSGALTFTTTDWDTAQTVTVTGVNDDDVNTTDRTATVTHTATSADTTYNNLASIASVTVTVEDDDAVAPSATLAAADPTTLGARRLNSSTNRATVTVTLMNTVYEPSADLTAADFTPSDTVDGDVTVESVTRTSDTVATLALAHTGAISSDGTVSVTVLDSAHTGSGDLPAGSLPIDATAPTVSSVAFSTTGPYGLGADIEMTITFNENVFVEGTTPNAILSTNSANRSAPYNRGSGSMELVFRHTVVAGDDDADGVEIFRSPLLGGGGIIRDAAGNDVGRLLTNSAITGGITQRVDATLPMLLTATVTGTALTLTYNEALDDTSTTLPSTTDYMVTVDTVVPVLVNSVAISDMTVTLTLASVVIGGRPVTLSYTPGANPVQDTVGNDAVMLDDRGVSNPSGTVSVSLNTIAGDDVVNIAERTAGFTISGMVADGATVEVTLEGGTPRGATETGTTWTLDIPSDDPDIIGTSVDVEATATLLGATGMVIRPLTLDLVAPTATYALPLTLMVGTTITAIMPGTPSADITSYALQAGTLPPGLTLTLDGTGGGTAGGISGTPTTANVATALVTIRLTDTASNPGDISITFPAVDLGSQTLDGFAYSADTATIGQTAPTVTAPTGAVVGSTLSYASGDEDVCTVDSVTGALTLVAAGSCVITVTASATNYNEATANFTITVSEVAGVTVSETERTVSEDGNSRDTYTLVLTSAPTAEVTIAVASDTDTAATVSSASLTFTTTDWDTAQTVTVIGVDDDVDNPGDERTATLSHTPTSADAGYNTVPIASVTVTVDDDDDAGITVSGTVLAVAEADGTGAYTLILDTQPAAEVTIAVASDATMVATVSPASLTFTSTDWNTAQTVTVTGVDDTINNTPPRTATVSHTATSGDSNYNEVAISIDPVTVTATDDDAALPVISIAAGLSVAEGTSVTFTVTAAPVPVGNLTVTVTVTDSGDFITGAPPTTVVIPPAGSMTLTVPTTDDGTDEPNGVVTAALRTGTGYMVGAPDTASVAVRDDDGATDPVISIAAAPSSVTEGTSATFTVTATPAPAAELTVMVTVDDGAGNFIAGVAPTMVTIAGGATEATLEVATMADSIDEANGMITATVTIGAGYTMDGTNNTASVTVEDDDAEPTLAISSPSVPEGNSGSVMLRYTVTLTGATEREVTVDYADAGTGTATSGTDYETITAGTLTFTPGDATTQDIDVTVTGDAIDEGDGETVIVTLSGAVNATIATADGTGTITDDDAPPTLAIDSPSVAEGDAGETPTLTYTVTLNGATEQTVTVDYADADSGTATSGTDYTAITAGTLTFVPGTTTQTIGVTVAGDTDEEGDETVIVTLSNPDNATIATADGTGTIRGDDAPVLPTISIAAASSPVTEADNATFTLTADPAPGTELIVTVTVDDGSGNFIASPAPTTVTITASTTTATLVASTDDDSVDEAEGMITATVTAGTGYTIALSPDNSATVTVEDNDPAPTLAIDSPTVLEGDGGSTAMLRYTVTLSGETEQEVTVVYADAAGTAGDGTATPDDDYETLTGGTLTFTPGGANTQNINVIVTGDAIDEENETVVLRLSGAVNATIATPDGAGTITDDDAAPTLAIDSPSVGEGNSGSTTLSYTVTLTGDTEREVTVDYADAGTGTATSGADYDVLTAGTLTFAPGTTTQNIDVTVTGDTEDEGDGETVVVRLSGAVNAMITTPDGTGTITDDDDPTLPAISIAAGPSPVTEGDNATFTLTAAPAPMADLTVTVMVDDGAGDFIASPAPTMVTITASNTTVTLTVMTEDDTTDEAEGMITATVTTMTGAGYTVSSSSTARVTVQDNDIVITGTPTGTVTEDAPTNTATGALMTVDDDFETQTGATDRANGLGAYGNFELTANGDWTYTLDNTPGDPQGDATHALPGSSTVTEVFTAVVSDADSSVEQEVTITITGANDAPIADAGLMQTVAAGAPVTLDGSGSSDPDTGDMIDAYAWSSTSTVTLSDATIEMPTFTAPVVTSSTDLSFSLVVNDGDTDSAPDTVIITVNPASAAPAVSTVEISSTGPYVVGDAIEVTVTFSEEVTVDIASGTPQIPLMVGANTRQAVYTGSSTTTTATLMFTYTVVDGETDADGVSITANTLSENSGTIRDPDDSTINADLNHLAVAPNTAHAVDTTAPTVSEVELSSNGPYALDEVIEVTVTFSEAVTVSGTPEITLTVGANERQATFSSGSDTAALVFTYMVVTGDSDDNGVSIPEDTLAQAAGSAIQDTAGNDANLDHDAVPADSAHAVDTTAPMLDTATVDGDTLTLTYDEALDDTSTPANDAYAVMVGGSTGPAVQNVSISGMAVTLTLATPVTAGQMVTLDYTPDANPVQDTAGNDAMMLDGQTVMNNTPMVLPTISIAAGPSPVTEGTAATFTLTAAPAPGTDLIVTVTVTETGTFISGSAPTTVMITASTTTATLTVTTDDDSIDEAPGMITATVTAGTGYMVAGGAGNTASVMVNDDDAAPTLAIDSPRMVTEGDDGETATLSYMVTLTGDTTQEVTVDYADAGLVGGGTATSGADYEPIGGGTLTFAPGTTTQTVDVTVRGDAIDEPDEETVIVMLSNPVNATIATDMGTGTITDDDPEPTLVIDSPNMFEGDDGDTATLRYTVTLSGDTEREVTVGYADAGAGTAESGTDYEALTAGTLTFAPGGATTQNIDVTVMGDVDDEGDEETVVVRLSGAVNATITTPDGTGTITDDDDPPALAINAPSVDEGDSGSVTLSYTVTLTGMTAQTVMVDYADAGGGTATSGTDYETITGGTLIFTPGGATTQTIAVTVTGDTIDEEDETVILRLSGAVNAEITIPDGTGTIDDDDDPPMLAISSPTMNEGNSGRAMLRYVVTLSGDTEREVTVDYADLGTGTATSGTDYDTLGSGTLTFAPGGAATQNIDVMVVGDTIDEANETVILRLSNPGNATIATADGTGTIDDDDAAPTLAINSLSVNEGDSGSVMLRYTVTLNGATARTVTVDYADAGTTGGGTATSGADYDAITAGTLTFAPGGAATQTIDVMVRGDTIDEEDQTVILRLSGATNATITTPDGTGTITDDDAEPGLAINSPSVGESDSMPLRYTVRLIGATEKEVTVQYEDSRAGSATSGADYDALTAATLTFAPGTTTQNIDVTVTDDTMNELTETVLITLSNPDNATITTGTGTGMITDDDVPVISIAAGPSVNEGMAATFTLTATPAPVADLTVMVTVDDGAGDFISGAAPTMVTITAGNTEATLDVRTDDDSTDEVDGMITVTVTAGAGYMVAGGGDSTDSVTVRDDDDPVISIAAGAPVTEGTPATFTVTASSAPMTNLTVTVTVDDGAGNFIASPAPTTVTILASAMMATLTVPTTDDTTDEANGMITATVEDGTGYTVDGVNNTDSVAVNDNDDPPMLAINSPSVGEGDSGTVTLGYVVTLTGATAQAVMVRYRVSGGTATSGVDYDAITAGTLTFAPGTTTQNIDVTVRGDTMDEPNETVIVTLSNPDNATITAGSGVGTGTITDDDDPVISIVAADPTVIEGASATFTVRATSAPMTNLTVTVAVTDGAGTFITGMPPTTVTIAASAMMATLTVPTTNDNTDEAPGMITATVMTGTGYRVAGGGGGTARVTVNDNDAEPTLAINSPSVTEGNSGTATLRYMVTLTGATARTVMVDYADAGGGTATSGTDYDRITAGTLTFAPGTTTQPINVTVRGDTTDEQNETVMVTLSNPVNATIESGRGTGTGTITDDDGPVISIAAGAAVTEGTAATFTLTATSAPGTNLTVTVTVDDGAGNFITGAPTSVTIPASGMTATLTVPTTNDNTDEAPGMITATVRDGTGYTVAGGGANTASVTVNDNDAPPTLAINSPSVPEGNSGTATLRYTVTLTGETEREVTVRYAEGSGGTATSGTDYTRITGGTLTFAPGTTTQNINVTVRGDTTDEPNETVIVTLSVPVNATIPAGSGTGTIIDDDDPEISIAAGAAVTEGTAATFTLTATSAPGTNLTVTVTVDDGAGNFIAGSAPTTVTISGSGTTATLRVPTMADSIDEANGMITATVRAGTGYTVAGGGAATASVTVNDNDDPPTLAINSPSVTEGDAGATATLRYVVTLTGRTENTVMVQYAGTGGTATSGTDYTAITAGTTLTFAPGTTTQNINVTVRGDADDEGDETVFVTLSVPVNATIESGRGRGTGTITDDDGVVALPVISIAAVGSFVNEGAPTIFTLTADPAPMADLTVTVTVDPGTYADGIPPTTVTITGGETTAMLTVPTENDTRQEEMVLGTITAMVEDGTGYTVGSPDTASVSVLDGDSAPSLSINSPQVAEGNTGMTRLRYTVTLTNESERMVTVQYAVMGGTATSGTDYTLLPPGTLTFAPRTTTQNIDVMVIGDTVIEPDETVIVMLSSPVNAGTGSSADRTGTGTITDDDLPTISIAAGTSPVTEGAPATFTLTANPAPAMPLTVTVIVNEAAGNDFITSPPPPTVVIPATGSVTLSVGTTDDTADEPNGMITATVRSGGTAYNVAEPPDNTASVTVNDNDTAVVPIISIAAGTSPVFEGAPATFTLRANVPPPATLTVMVTVTALGGDFIGSPLPTTVMITTSGLTTLTVPTMDDSINEPEGIITATVTAGTGYTVATGGGNTASVIVRDNDVPVISIAAGTSSVNEGAPATFTLTANPTPAADLTVTVTVTDSGDFITGAPPATVTITGSATTATLEVQTTDDTTPETLGMITAMVTAGDGYTVGTPAMATVDVRDDDTGIVISIAAGTSPVPEGMAATFTLTADPAPLANLPVTVTVTDSGDFITSAPPPTVVIPPAGSVTLTVQTTDDTTPEPNGVITATVTSGAGYMPAGGGADSASVTVNNDDREAPTEPGVFVSQTELSIEEGSEAIYTVVLDTAPAASVTITPMVAPASDVLSEIFSPGDEVPATVSEALTFTPANWNVPQPVTVTGVDNNRTGALFLQVRVRHMASSSDGDYDSVGIASVRVDVFDDDPLLIISHTERTVAEAGGMAEYTVVMGFRLRVDLPVSLASDDPTVATVSPTELTFTPSNWDTPRTVTVTGVNDPFDNPDDRTATISHTHMVDGRDFGSPSLTEDIRNFVSRSVVVTATDDETAGVTISPAPGMPMVSLGDEATYTVVLDTPPTDGVLIILREEFFQDGSAMVVDVSPFDERTLIPLPLRFTPSAWNVPQTVTVFGREVGTASLMYSAGSRDDSYHEIDIAPLVITVADNGPVARVRVSPAMVQVGEDSGTTEYTVVLDNRPPTADVTITPASGDTAIATVSPTELTFTPDNWNIAQPVTVTGVDDPDYNPPFGNRAVAVSHTAASSDVNYNGRSIDPVTVTVVDDEIRPAGVIVTDIIGGLIIVGELDDFDTELGLGRTNTYALVLNRQPTDNVTVTPVSGDTAIARVSGALTFTPDNWNTAQTVTVTGVNDDVDNSGDTRTVTITHTAVSMEDAYDGITIDTVTVTVEDDDTPGAIVSPTELSIEENGDGIYTVVLGTVPTAPVMITPMVAPNSDVLSETFSPGDEVPATVSGVALTFTTTNWNVPQTVTVTGVDNNRTGTLFLRVRVRHMAESLDSDYNGVGIASVRVDVFDDDPLLIISESALTVAENGGMATYTVVMGVRLSVDLPVSLASDTTSVATVSPTGLTFTPDNWDTPQTVTVTGVNDPFDNPDDRTVTISHTHMVDGRDFGSSSEEEDIRELVSRSVVVTAIDDETAGVTISPEMHMVSVRSRATYTVVLDTPPTDGVLIILREEFFQDGAAMVVDVSPFDARTLIPLPLRFTPSTWNMPQTVTVFGREAGTASLMYRARSRDDSYHDIDIAPLVITVVE